jgi:hypothetical protein
MHFFGYSCVLGCDGVMFGINSLTFRGTCCLLLQDNHIHLFSTSSMPLKIRHQHSQFQSLVERLCKRQYRTEVLMPLQHTFSLPWNCKCINFQKYFEGLSKYCWAQCSFPQQISCKDREREKERERV